MESESSASRMLSVSEDDRRIVAGMPGPFLRWYRANARDLPWRRDREPYHVWLSEIMLQQTRVEAAKGYYRRFIEALPDIRALASADEETVLKLWEGLGYYRRALNLRKAARLIAVDMGGVFPSTYKEILALPGVGAYTAGAIASICFGLPKPAVDGNVLRVMARILDNDMSVDRPTFQKWISACLEEAMVAACANGATTGLAFDAGDFNQSLMEVGATLCLPKGMLKCSVCPARLFCRGMQSGRAELLPVRDVKKVRRVEERTVFILQYNAIDADGGRQNVERLALARRGSDGLLAGMWELPNVAGWLRPDEAIAYAAALGATPIALEQSLDRSHVFSHVEWRMKGYVIRCSPPELMETTTCPSAVTEATDATDAADATDTTDATDADIDTAAEADTDETSQGLIWTSVEERKTAYPLPSAFRVFLG